MKRLIVFQARDWLSNKIWIIPALCMLNISILCYGCIENGWEKLFSPLYASILSIQLISLLLVSMVKKSTDVKKPEEPCALDTLYTIKFEPSTINLLKGMPVEKKLRERRKRFVDVTKPSMKVPIAKKKSKKKRK